MSFFWCFFMVRFLEQAAAFLWGPGTLLLVLGAGVYLTVGTRGLTVTKLFAAFGALTQGEGEGRGEISGWDALCTSLAGTLGTGNIIGVATALVAGGPGALFYMTLAALFGMATKYTEGYLAVCYRRKTHTGFLGGPFLYLEQLPHGRRLGRLFGWACLLCCLISMGTTSQIQGMVTAVTDFLDPHHHSPALEWGPLTLTLPAVAAGLLTTLLVGGVLLGGIRRIARVSTRLVPLMASLYSALILWVIILNVDKIPAATRLILQSALCPRAVFGGACGYTLQSALRYGLGRGIFSNEAGMGSDPIAAAAARTDHPAKQGLIMMLGPLIDTVVMCNLTGYALLVTDAWQVDGLSGAEITFFALQQLPLPNGVLAFLYMLCLFFFGFSSILGWSFYGRQSLLYLFPRRPRADRVFLVLFLLFLMVGAVLSADAVWALADLFCALMLIPNLIGVLLLSPKVFEGTRRYFNTN